MKLCLAHGPGGRGEREAMIKSNERGLASQKRKR